MTSSSNRALKPRKPREDGERDTASSEIQDVVKRVEVRAQVFKAAIRRTVEEAWELGDALLPAKVVIGHGHWAPWLRKMGLNSRLAQRCMALRRRYPEKRHVSDFKSIQAALRMLPAKRTIDAEFEVEEVEGHPKDGSKPKPSALSARSDASDPSASRNGDAISKGPTDGDPSSDHRQAAPRRNRDPIQPDDRSAFLEGYRPAGRQCRHSKFRERVRWVR